METSDSECFESADEDFHSDNEDNSSKTSFTKKSTGIGVTKLENLKLAGAPEDAPLQVKHVNTEKRNKNKPEKKERQSKPKLGVKLGTKIKKSDLNLPPVEGEACALDTNHNSAETSSLSNGNNPEHDLKANDSTSVAPEENMWENDDWEPMDMNNKAEEKAPQDDENSGWGWGNWGVSTLLSTATVGVTTITSHVSQGLTTVIESGIGVPEPEELARLHKTEETKHGESEQVEDKHSRNLGFGLGNFVTGVSQITKLVETTGNKVITGGLDTLETIGKKTMQVLQDGDPGLKKKRAFLKIDSDKPVLSHVLREAKEKAEDENKQLEETRFSKKANYETLFDDHQGLVHLEALEMLSKQCDIKLKTLIESQSGGDLMEMQETMSQVNELCELVEEEEDESLDLSEVKEKLETAVSEMNVPISYDKLISTWMDAEQWLGNINLNICDELELHEQAIDTLAQLTAIAVEQFHKIGELLLIKEHRSTADEADSLVQLTTVLTTLISHVATKLANKLNEKLLSSSNKERVSSLITNVYFEAANSSSYIKDAFQLLIPVLQVGAV